MNIVARRSPLRSALRLELPPITRLAAADGFELAARAYVPSARLRGTILMASATAVRQRFYAPFARHAAERGFRVITFDYRGIGDSRPASLRGFAASMTDWAKLDSARAVQWAHSFGDPVLLVGHSFGGQAVGLLDALRTVRAAVFVGSQLGDYRNWSAFERAKLLAIWYGLIPSAVGLFGYLPGRLGMNEDLPGGVAREWARWCTSEGYFLEHHPDAAERFESFACPTLVYSFTDDAYAPAAAVDAYIRQFSPGRVLHRRLRPSGLGVRSVGHFGFFRAEQGGGLWDEALAFFDDALADRDPRVAALASTEPLSVGMADVMADLQYGRD